MHQLDLALTVMGLAVVTIALLSAAIHRNPLSEPMLAMAVGVAVGPYGFGWLELSRWGDETMILEQASRLTLAIGLMGVALRLRRESVRRLLRPVGLLLTAGMLGMWLLSSLAALWILQIPLWAALLLGAIVTPTDPVVASAIVTGNFADRHLPLRLRDGLSFESGANDGLAYLLVMLPVLMLGHGPTAALSTWLLQSFLIGVIFGIGLPFDAWAALGWPLAGLAAAVLLVRRAPVIAALFPFIRGYWKGKDACFLGWFAPIGIAAIYYASLAEKHTGDPLYWHVASALVFVSIIAHGMTAGPLTRRYSLGERASDARKDAGIHSANTPDELR